MSKISAFSTIMIEVLILRDAGFRFLYLPFSPSNDLKAEITAAIAKYFTKHDKLTAEQILGSKKQYMRQ